MFLNHFPTELGTPRDQQTTFLKQMEAGRKDGYKFFIGQLSVGAGKSGVAVAVARTFPTFILTPQISLQNQYLTTFDRTTPLVGRARFPCLRKNPEAAIKSISTIRKGEIPQRPLPDDSCAAAPCLNRPKSKSDKIKVACEADVGCPHAMHIEQAMNVETVVSNVHAFLFNVSMNANIPERRAMVIDEAHMIHNILLDFLKIKFKIRRKVDPKEYEDFVKTDDWIEFLREPQQIALVTKDEDSRDSYVARLERLERLGETVWSTWNDTDDGCLWLEIGPVYVGNHAKWLLWDKAEYHVLLSGTILDKDLFCRQLGIDPLEAMFINIPSDFPVENRLVYLPQTDVVLDFKNFDNNIAKASKEVNRILSQYHDVRGLIHVNSYSHAKRLVEHCKNHRLITHTSENFHQVLADFTTSGGRNQVIVSPSCVEGVDLKDDLCRVCIVLTPAYPSAGDPYWKYKLAKGAWQEYNYSVAKSLQQALGRGVRHNKDHCDSWLIDSRFTKFLGRNQKFFAKWWVSGVRNELHNSTSRKS